MSDLGITLSADTDGRRSSTRLGRRVVADALGEADPIGAGAARRETAWRQNYTAHMRRLVEAGVHEDPQQAIGIAERGLAALRENIVLRVDGEDRPVEEVFSRPAHIPLTETIVGRGDRETELSIPLRGERLTGAALERALDDWVDRGIMEHSAAVAVREVMAHPEWLRLPGRSVAVLGATAEMGPLQSLLRWGASVHAIDLPRPELWRQVQRLAREHAGTLHYPVTNSRPGADLLTELGSIGLWLRDIDSDLVVGNYVYADGVVNLRLSAAVDLLIDWLFTQREVALAGLATPTDIFAVDDEVVRAATEAYASGRVRRWIRPAVRTVSGGKLLRRNYAPDQVPGINDSVIPQQGPNYLLAKRVHRWRATVARHAGHQVSFNIAPPTRTRSVVSNRALATAYAGAHRFGVEVFSPATSNTLMAALLVHDLCTEAPEPTIAWRQEGHQSVHGGLWRIPYAPRSALGLALVMGFTERG